MIGKDDRVDRAQDWRQRPDVSHLPKSDRDEFELWLMEQTYRYCRGLEERPNSAERLAAGTRDPRPRRRLNASPSVLGAQPPSASQAGDDADQLPGSAGSPAQSAKSTAAVSPWLDEYLLGVAAECDRESGSDETLIQARRRAAERRGRALPQVAGASPEFILGTLPRSGRFVCVWDRFAEAVDHLRHASRSGNATPC